MVGQVLVEHRFKLASRETAFNAFCDVIRDKMAGLGARNNVFDKNSFEHLNVAVSVKRYRALFMDA